MSVIFINTTNLTFGGSFSKIFCHRTLGNSLKLRSQTFYISIFVYLPTTWASFYIHLGGLHLFHAVTACTGAKVCNQWRHTECDNQASSAGLIVIIQYSDLIALKGCYVLMVTRLTTESHWRWTLVSSVAWPCRRCTVSARTCCHIVLEGLPPLLPSREQCINSTSRVRHQSAQNLLQVFIPNQCTHGNSVFIYCSLLAGSLYGSPIESCWHQPRDFLFLFSLTSHASPVSFYV